MMLITIEDLLNKYHTNINPNKMHKKIKYLIIGINKDIFNDTSQYDIEKWDNEIWYKRKGTKKDKYEIVDKCDGTVYYRNYYNFLIDFDNIRKPTYQQEGKYDVYTYKYEYHTLKIKMIPNDYKSIYLTLKIDWVDAKPHPIKQEIMLNYKGEFIDLSYRHVANQYIS